MDNYLHTDGWGNRHPYDFGYHVGCIILGTLYNNESMSKPLLHYNASDLYSTSKLRFHNGDSMKTLATRYGQRTIPWVPNDPCQDHTESQLETMFGSTNLVDAMIELHYNMFWGKESKRKNMFELHYHNGSIENNLGVYYLNATDNHPKLGCLVLGVDTAGAEHCYFIL